MALDGELFGGQQNTHIRLCKFPFGEKECSVEDKKLETEKQGETLYTFNFHEFKLHTVVLHSFLMLRKCQELGGIEQPSDFQTYLRKLGLSGRRKAEPWRGFMRFSRRAKAERAIRGKPTRFGKRNIEVVG
jgi:hypothetical protein